MAIAQTGAFYKALNFDGQSSRTYGVYITGEAVYNAPERDVEMISIPGRNGAFAMDRGRFENITVTYPAGIFADNEADFADAISDFRNYLCSRSGYCRLTDDYNPDEYRLAVYKSGLEVDPALLRAGQFNIVFECKPQRFLTSGETAIAVSSGDEITNPTLFAARPLLDVLGKGDIDIGGGTISILNEEIGEILLSNDTTGGALFNVPFDEGNYALLNIGDEFYISPYSTYAYKLFINGNNNYIKILSATITASSSLSISVSNTILDGTKNASATITVNEPIVFVKGTSSTKTITVNVSASLYSNGSTTSYTGSMTMTYEYDSAYDRIQFRTSAITPAPPAEFISGTTNNGTKIKAIYGNSSRWGYADDIYIDLETGEAYGEIGGVVSSLNNIVTIPALLPALSPGANEITFDNTITSLKVVPRWWKV